MSLFTILIRLKEIGLVPLFLRSSIFLFFYLSISSNSSSLFSLSYPYFFPIYSFLLLSCSIPLHQLFSSLLLLSSFLLQKIFFLLLLQPFSFPLPLQRIFLFFHLFYYFFLNFYFFFACFFLFLLSSLNKPYFILL
jgi:hypothetical protein